MHSLSRRRALRGVALLVAGSPFVVAPRSIAAATAPLAIKGYDPVAYFTDGRPVRGRPEIEYEWDDYRYRFATAGHRELFTADPVRYAPQFADFCAMALSKGELVEADPESWLINDGKLYLFGKPEGPELFRRNLAENRKQAGENGAILRKQ